jgi:hypothetical protein
MLMKKMLNEGNQIKNSSGSTTLQVNASLGSQKSIV